MCPRERYRKEREINKEIKGGRGRERERERERRKESSREKFYRRQGKVP